MFTATGTRQRVPVLPSVPDICIDGHKIQRVSSHKFLGVRVDESLSWDTHISEISKKVAKALGALRRLKPICPHQILASIYRVYRIYILDSHTDLAPFS